jgi:hypothetical protein
MTPMTDPMTDGPGLFELTRENGEKVVTNVRRLAGSRSAPGRGLINTAAVLLGLLDAGLFAISLAAQYQYILHAKHQSWPAVIEAVALDAGMVIFSLLALGLARGRQAAPVERALIVVCAIGSAAMNYGAADVSSLRSVAAYVMPPVFLAIVTDRVIAVVRRHMLGMEAERSAWAVIGRVVLVALAAAGKAVLYGLRLVLAPGSTCSGARTLVLLATPLPGAHALVQEHAQVDAARAALGTVRTAIDEELRELRDRHELTAAHAGDTLRAAQEAFRTDAQAVREAVRTATEAVRDTVRTEMAAVRETALTDAPRAVREAIEGDLRELRGYQEASAAGLSEGLRSAREEFRTEIAAVREAVRTDAESVRDTLRTEIAAVREAQAANAAKGEPPAVDRDAVVAELASQIRDAISSGDRWSPDYGELMTRTGYGRSWCEKAVRDARTQVLDALGPEEAAVIRDTRTQVSATPGNPDRSPS